MKKTTRISFNRMRIEEKDIDLIEKYLEGNLTGQDFQEFKQRLEEDSEFRESLEEMETIVSGIRYTGRRKIQHELDQLEANLPRLRQENETKVVAMRRTRTWAAAASVFLVAVTAFWFFNKSQIGDEQLFISYYQPYPNVESPTTRGETGLSLREQAYAAYDLEQYDEAADFFDDIDENEKKEIDKFYQALSYLSSQDPVMAEKMLTGYVKSGDEIMQGKARWYLALTKLQLGKTKESEEILKAIVTDETFNFKKADRLLKELH